MPAMLGDSIDFYHFVPLSVALTLARGCGVNRRQNLLASFSRLFQLVRIKFDVVMRQFKLIILILLLGEIYVIKEK